MQLIPIFHGGCRRVLCASCFVEGNGDHRLPDRKRFGLRTRPCQDKRRPKEKALKPEWALEDSCQTCPIPALGSSLVHWTSRRFENNGDPRVILLWNFQVISQLIMSGKCLQVLTIKCHIALLWPRIQNPDGLVLMRSSSWHFSDMSCNGKRICFFISEESVSKWGSRGRSVADGGWKLPTTTHRPHTWFWIKASGL